MAPFFEPISGKWITQIPPLEPAPEPVVTLSEHELVARNLRLDKIWEATVSSALACQIEPAPKREIETEGDGSGG